MKVQNIGTNSHKATNFQAVPRRVYSTKQEIISSLNTLKQSLISTIEDKPWYGNPPMHKVTKETRIGDACCELLNITDSLEKMKLK